MNQKLQQLLDLIQQSLHLSDDDKSAMLKSIKEVDKEIEITNFKLDRTEKVKRTTGILLEETIEELEQKRKAVEAQKRVLEMEASLEKIRAQALGMRKPGDLLDICEILYTELRKMGFDELRNAMINIYEEGKLYFLNYDYSSDTGKTVTRMPYGLHPLIDKQVSETKNAGDAFNEFSFTGKELKEFRNLRKNNGEPDDPKLDGCSSLHYYFYSIGTGSIGISTYKDITSEKLELLKRFRNVFEFAYRRYMDVAKAEAQSREAQIELGLERVRARAMAMQNSEELKELIGTVFTELTRLDIVLTRCLIMIYDPGNKGSWWWMANSEAQHEPIGLFVQYHEHPPYLAYLKAWEERAVSWQYDLQGQIKKDWDDYLFSQTELNRLPDFVIAGMKAPDSVILSASFNNFGNLTLATLAHLSEEHGDILLRFAKVFDLTYTRFNDLQKAEAQTREAQIEAGLERVRYSAMAMQSSEDVGAATAVVFNEISLLGVEAMRCGITIIHPDKTADVWAATTTNEGKEMKGMGIINFANHPLWVGLFNAWNNKEESFTYALKGDDLRAYYTILANSPNYDSSYIQNQEFPDHVFYASFFEQGAVFTFSLQPQKDEKRKILKRFTAVFSLTFRRYLDLKQAEAQAREAQIEAALERVRSHTMAMHKSSDLLDVISALSEQFQQLGFKIDSANFNTSYREKDWNLWLYYPGTAMYPEQIHIPYFDHPFFNRTLESVAKGNDFNACIFTKEEKDGFLNHLFTNTLAKNAPEERKKYTYEKPGFAWSTVYLKNTAVTIANYDAEPYTDEQNAILRRFGNAFEQSYTRFLDLQKAEAQARESQIELALERVRARTMAMQKSNELLETSMLLFQQFKELGATADQAAIAIVNEEEGVFELSATVYGNQMLQVYKPKLDDPFVMGKIYKAWKTKQKSIVVEITGEELRNYNILRNSLMRNNTATPAFYKEEIGPEDRWIVSAACFSKGALSFSSSRETTKETLQIVERFAKVFEQTYTRFLDLQKAEAQAREAQIEAGLERVRSRTMAMQQSVELTETTKLLFEEFKKFQTEPDMTNLSRGFITTINEEKQCFDLWITDIDGNEIKQYFKIDFTEPTTGTHMYHGWKNKEPRVITDLQGKQLSQWLDYLSGTGFPVAPGIYNTRRINNFIYHSKGFIGITSSLPLTDESLRLLERFAKVFDLTYTRFADLQNAETRALLAVQEASLDRVRAEIASMRTAEDLQHITPLVWRELMALGVPFFRCGVFIVDDEKQKIHFYLSAPDGKPLAALELGFDGAEVTQKATAHWREQKVYISHWTKEEFKQFALDLVSQGQIQSANTYQGGEEAPESLTLQFVPFEQGMMYVGSAEDLPEPQIELVQSLANAFSTAYARYEDFNKLEAAKQQVDSAFRDLRATQTQLIQSEKMASLGELTAGIAHEIQNPLNFVNNFSEVSTELVEEMNEEIQKGNLDDARQIAADLKDNLSKINHHGKRAGDIVKGMLQHSRSSSGVKEPTDINALADEYLRLAYHGLRAKDKSFNATMKTDFDESIGMIDMIPQDVGRVILNLITNAFYAVDEKKKKVGDNYEPTVSVSTKNANGKIEISVKDNGNGIPAKVLDKIFQPFFTTKPTGKGTGLGLSLSYDIVKAHGGELKVETKENEGTDFIIELPIN